MRGRPATRTPRARSSPAHLPLIRYELQPGLGVAVMKQNLYDAGIIASARVRHPTRTLDPVDIAEVRALRAELDLLAFRWAPARSG